METLLSYLTVLSVFALLTLPSFIGIARDRRIDRQLREAANAPSGQRVIGVPVRKSPANKSDLSVIS